MLLVSRGAGRPALQAAGCPAQYVIKRNVESTNAMCLNACRMFSKFVGSWVAMPILMGNAYGRPYTFVLVFVLFALFLHAIVHVRVLGGNAYITARKTYIRSCNGKPVSAKRISPLVLWIAMPKPIRTNGTLRFATCAILPEEACHFEKLIVHVIVRRKASRPRYPDLPWSPERMPWDEFWKGHPLKSWARSISSPTPKNF